MVSDTDVEPASVVAETLSDLSDETSMGELSKLSIGVPSGLRPMSARRLNLRCMAVSKAIELGRKASASAANETVERMLKIEKKVTTSYTDSNATDGSFGSTTFDYQ